MTHYRKTKKGLVGKVLVKAFDRVLLYCANSDLRTFEISDTEPATYSEWEESCHRFQRAASGDYCDARR